MIVGTTARVPRAALDELRRALAATMPAWEPSAGDWERVDPAHPFDWTAARPFVSPKRFFFPPRETVLSWDANGRMIPAPGAVVEPFALFGLRACDATALAVQDRFFALDASYRARRAAAVTIAVDCLAACAGGFCRDVDAGPFAVAGCDVALTVLDEANALVTIVTPAGATLLERLGVAIGDDGAAARNAAREAAARTFPDRPFVARTIARLDPATTAPVADEEWARLGPSCLACTGCTSLCPTCTCWALADEPEGDGGTRVRLWDSCLLEGFQREAGGHPAPTAGARVRRYWEHKLSHAFDASLGRLGCVGCGRCDVTCPGSIGALHVTQVLGA